MDGLDIDGLPVGIVRLDSNDRVVAANAWFHRWADSGPVEGRRVEEFLVPAADFLSGAGRLSVMMASPIAEERAVFVVRSEQDGGTLLIVMDASDRYAAGHHLRESHVLADRTQSRLQLIIDASIAFAAAPSEERLGEILADTAARAYRAEEAVVFLRDGARVRHIAGSNPFEGLLPDAMLDAATDELQRVIKVSGIAEATALSPDLARAMESSGVQALIVAPVHLEGASFGFYACFFRHPRQFDEEAAPLAEALANQAAQKLATDRLQRRLEHAAMHDETTNLPNRRRLEALTSDLQRVRQVSVIFIDLDGFKEVNDRLGHELGDQLLREVARRLESNVRESDVVARYGGDEFVVVSEADTATAAEVAERLRVAIQQPYPFLPVTLRIASSIGISTAVVDASLSVDRLIRGADQAMYVAKGRGGNQIALAG
jgi:diguanylate cyclase (GGDEF)-like protein